MTTETLSARYKDLDLWPTGDFVSSLIDSQLSAIASLQAAHAQIVFSIDQAALRLSSEKGRLIYVGAGSSGRLAVQDAVELNPTFSWPDERLHFLIAGGEGALVSAKEGNEDSAKQAEQDVQSLKMTKADVMISLAASGGTPYTVAAAKSAKSAGAFVIGISNNLNTALSGESSVGIELNSGSEMLAGSTRMAAGTAQKAVLNAISTGIMIRLHRVYSNLMIDLNSSNIKLDKRRANIVAQIANSSEDEAAQALKTAQGDIRLAVLMLHGLDANEAQVLLKTHQRNLRECLTKLKG